MLDDPGPFINQSARDLTLALFWRWFKAGFSKRLYWNAALYSLNCSVRINEIPSAFHYDRIRSDACRVMKSQRRFSRAAAILHSDHDSLYSLFIDVHYLPVDTLFYLREPMDKMNAGKRT